MGDSRFRAFISYSHADEAWGAWLQRTLEAYRPPKSLAAADGRTRRLGPVFRDREDLPVAGNLNAAIQQALADSEYQIVLCSPRSATSRWVNEEIKLFHKLHGPGRVFALIIGGEPGASATPGREAEECFPPALRFQLDADGEITGAPAEPLAADARETGDGKRFAMLKVAAGMLGVGLDDLVRRDDARRARRLWAITVASLAGMTGAGALAFVAIIKSIEATKMRGEAEDLIEFMLTDLRDRIEEVGRLDVLESVGAQAMGYYADQNLRTLGDDALARRAKALLLIGQIEFKRNELGAAETAFLAAESATLELLRRSPRNGERIFDHAQSVFYVSDAARGRGDMATAERKLNEYYKLAKSLVALDAGNPLWRLEIAYATSNLGILKLNAGEYDAAVENFTTSIEERRRLADADPGNEKVAFAYAYAISWRALAEMSRGRFRAAIGLIEQQLNVHGPAGRPTSNDFRTLDVVVTAQRRLAECYLALGDIARARAAIIAATGTADRLTTHDPKNANWLVNASYIAQTQSILAGLDGDRTASREAADKGLSYARAATTAEGGDVYEQALAHALTQRLASGGGDPSDDAIARALAQRFAAFSERDAAKSPALVAKAAIVLSQFYRTRGRPDAGDPVRRAIAMIEAASPHLDIAQIPVIAALYLEGGNVAAASALIDDMGATELRSPDFQQVKQRLAK